MIFLQIPVQCPLKHTKSSRKDSHCPVVGAASPCREREHSTAVPHQAIQSEHVGQDGASEPPQHPQEGNHRRGVRTTSLHRLPSPRHLPRYLIFAAARKLFGCLSLHFLSLPLQGFNFLSVLASAQGRSLGAPSLQSTADTSTGQSHQWVTEGYGGDGAGLLFLTRISQETFNRIEPSEISKVLSSTAHSLHSPCTTAAITAKSVTSRAGSWPVLC